MAKNYTITEAVKIISAGTDMEAIVDIGRRYPILLNKVTKVAALAGESFVDFMSYMPEHLTANKVNTLMKNNVETEDAADEEVGEADKAEEPKKTAKEKATKAAKAESSDSGYESMSGKELWELLGKTGKRKDCKEKMGGVKRDDMLAYINKYGLDEAAENEAEEVEETSENPYEGIAAPELFKECKKRGLKAVPKKPAKYYIDLLVKSDEEVASKASKSDEAEDDDWGDEEEVAEEPKKTEKKKPAEKPTKKAAKEEAEDDDDDWDI